jgi:hypothetical protein
MNRKATEGRIAQQEIESRGEDKAAARAKAARKKRRARAKAPGAALRPAADSERAPQERRREVIASLWRVAEEQTRALEASRGAPLPSSELKALVDVLERLERLEKNLPPAPPKRSGPPQSADEIEIAPFSFEEANLMIEEIARRFEEFVLSEPPEEDEAAGGPDGPGATPPAGGETAPISQTADAAPPF